MLWLYLIVQIHLDAPSVSQVCSSALRLHFSVKSFQEFWGFCGTHVGPKRPLEAFGCCQRSREPLRSSSASSNVHVTDSSSVQPHTRELFSAFYQRDGPEFGMCVFQTLCRDFTIRVNREAKTQVPVRHESEESDVKCSFLTTGSSMSAFKEIHCPQSQLFVAFSDQALKILSKTCRLIVFFHAFQSQEKQDLHAVPVVLDHVPSAHVGAGSEIGTYMATMQSGFPIWVSLGSKSQTDQRIFAFLLRFPCNSKLSR